MCVCVVVAGQKGGRWTYSRTLNKAVNMSEGGKEVKMGDTQEEGVKEVFFVVGAKANPCRRRRR